ncbi:MAG: hypothetical protein LBC17_04650 [Lactobacillaceae bacterium]|jgi:hypothetical protein|nr:hypothetical protein [Lactobacillaceae bacterium]
MDLNKITEFTKKIVSLDQEINFQNYNDSKLIDFIKLNNNLSNDELLFSLGLFWAKKFENKIAELNKTTPFSVGQILALIIGIYYKNVPVIKEIDAKFPDLIFYISSALHSSAEVPEELKGKYSTYVSNITQNNDNNNKNNNGNVYISQAINTELENVFDRFINTSKENEYLFVITDDIEVNRTDEFVFAFQKYTKQMQLKALMQFDKSYFSGSEVSLVVFQNKKGDNSNMLSKILIYSIPPINDFGKIDNFKNYIDEWNKNNGGK